VWLKNRFNICPVNIQWSTFQKVLKSLLELIFFTRQTLIVIGVGLFAILYNGYSAINTEATSTKKIRAIKIRARRDGNRIC
jgi:hypothetical protein